MAGSCGAAPSSLEEYALIPIYFAEDFTTQPTFRKDLLSVLELLSSRIYFVSTGVTQEVLQSISLIYASSILAYNKDLLCFVSHNSWFIEAVWSSIPYIKSPACIMPFQNSHPVGDISLGYISTDWSKP